MTDQARRSSSEPPDPLLATPDRSVAAELPVCRAIAELNKKPELAEVLAEEPVELLELPDDEAADELEVLEVLEEPEVLEEFLVGLNVLFPAPKPMSVASVPLTTTWSLLNFPLMTSLPLLLIDAVTCAPPGLVLMVLIRSATVSVPVDVYVVVLVPSLTVITPWAGIPRLDSGVLVVSGTVPVPLARELEGLEAVEELDALEPLDEDDACFDRVAIWLLTRVRASWLAMLARPVAMLVMAESAAAIAASVLESD
jgi:hypothetical protein